jgi:hypothetical protein
MKVKMKKVAKAILFACVLTVGIISTASAKFWGWQNTSTTDWADGKCAYRQTCRVHYILWIGGEEECNTVTIACIGDD